MEQPIPSINLLKVAGDETEVIFVDALDEEC